MLVLLSALKLNKKLLCLDLERIELTNSKLFEYLCLFLKQNKVIKSLRLSWNSFLPKQIVSVMKHIKRKKTLYFLDLSNNSLAFDKRSLVYIKDFVNTMRRFVLRSQIFHLNLNGMSLGSTVTKLLHSFKASSTLNCVHLCMNNIPEKIIRDMDFHFNIPEHQMPKINKFRPLKNEVEEEKDTTATATATSTIKKRS